MDKTWRSVEICNFSAMFVALGLELPVLVGDPLAVAVLLVVAALLVGAVLPDAAVDVLLDAAVD
jgi:hypothetical protein